jgi:steroid delta-isomerase
MKDALQQYLDGFNQGNAEMIISLFAEDARIEDPVGGGWIVEGKEAIAEFYRRGVEVVERLELDTPIRGSHGRSAAMAFTIHMKMDGKKSIIRAIDVMTFDDSGKIVDMKAYHGPSDVLE